MSQVDKAPKLFIYSTILPVIWLSFGSIFSYFFPEKKLGVMGLVLIIHLALLPICWHFSKNFNRHFLKNEKIRLVIYLTLWAFICESLGLLYVFSLDSQSSMPTSALLGILGFTLAMDTLFMYLGVQFAGKHFVNYFMSKREAESA